MRALALGTRSFIAYSNLQLTAKRLLKPALAIIFAMATPLLAQQPRLVIIDQDGSGPGGSNQMAMMVLLQSPQVKVLGITMVSGPAA